MEYTQSDKDRIIKRVKEGENALLEYTKEIREKIGSKASSIDDLEMIMLKTMQTMKHFTLAIMEDALTEEGLKKTRSKRMKNVERK
jgi:hypothetical protein